MLYTYAPSLVSNPRDEISHFVTGVAVLVMEECNIAVLHDNMTLARLMVYEQSIEDSKLRKNDRIWKKSGANDQEQARFKKRA